MRPVVIGTAGHIDHGKTALVGRLTGIDTDRLKEEKERGISIDLGFAHLTLPSGRRVAIVDVPGHERFVKNMLAGATGIDLVLLVIAADEGVKPQTREHLAIVDLLHVTRGVIALTKADLASPERIRASTEEARGLLASTSLAKAPIVPVSSTTGAGIDVLIQEVERAVASVEARSGSEAVRLPVDRVFSVEGIGTVVTGTLWSGAIRTGDTLERLPESRAVRVRQVEVHDAPVPEALAGNRTALALHGVSKEDLSRGDWLVTPGRFRATDMLDARLTLLRDAERSLEHRARVRVHLGASEILARVVLPSARPLVPGETGLVQLRLESPVVAVPRDRLVLRSYSPATTVGGATVIDPSPAKRARLDQESEARLLALETGTLQARIERLAADARLTGIRVDPTAMRLGEEPARVEAAARESKALLRLEDGRYLDRASWTKAVALVLDAVRRYQEEHPLRHGIGKGELKALLAETLDAGVFDEALQRLLAERKIVPSKDRIALPEAGPALTEEQARALQKVEGRLQASGFQVPDLSGVLREVPPSAKPAELARYLVESGRAVKVTSELLYPAPLWAEIERRVLQHFTRGPSLTMGDFKDLLQVSRKYAVPLLEHLDRTGLTRREGDVRIPGPRART
ncbi:MAG TPA: selenocysteine-specific translation elongation factor [Candidatus Eisenbacteria bacterium]|nr:selenocysteine-specific translation elongation factor [Candidatus Eisenbacteria bacterium]